jgi:hypothetical protein
MQITTGPYGGKCSLHIYRGYKLYAHIYVDIMTIENT